MRRRMLGMLHAEFKSLAAIQLGSDSLFRSQSLEDDPKPPEERFTVRVVRSDKLRAGS